MEHSASTLSVLVFVCFAAFTLGLSFYFAAKSKSAAGYFAAGGQIHWFVNGIAFAGDFLSAASFLGICGVIAFFGYDGFLYSIGFLAGWVVALLVVAEPLKRLGKYTFADALNSKFQSRGITFAAGASSLVVSIVYLIPQMVGAGALIKPLLGFPHEVGVLLVGTIVVLIVATAGMVSTTYVQFLKGAMLVFFSAILVVMILNRGFKVDQSPEAMQPQTLTKLKAGGYLVGDKPRGLKEGQANLRPVGHISQLPDGKTETGPLGPLTYLSTLQQSEIVVWEKKVTKNDAGDEITTWSPVKKPGTSLLRPGNWTSFKGLQSLVPWDDAEQYQQQNKLDPEIKAILDTPEGERNAEQQGKLSKIYTANIYSRINFVSLMLALFLGTASLPHILIRYYTVKNQEAARLSTVVGIATIGAFYVLTLYLGLGAMTSGSIDPSDTNMAAPLLAKSFGDLIFAVISAIAFTTVLGTVSGLIVAASGAIVHDLLVSVGRFELTDHEKVRVGKIAAVIVGLVAIGLGILCKEMNASFLVGWAFSVAASANLPSLVMLLFWKRTTSQGITAAVLVGMFASLAWILVSADAFQTYGYAKPIAEKMTLVPFSQPGIVTIPLGFLTLIVVSLCTRPKPDQSATASAPAAS